MKKSKVLMIAGMAILSASMVSADVIAQYNFSADLSATSADANVAAGAVGLGAGISGGNAGRSGSSLSLYARSSVTHSANQISRVNAIADGDYFNFSVTPDAGYEMDLTSFQFDFGYTRNGSFEGKQFKAYLLTSIDGFVDAGDIVGSKTIDIGPNTSTPVYTATTIDLSGAQFQNITSATEFRIYIADNTGANDYIHRIDNITLNGSVSVIPEPATFGLLGFGALVTMVLRRRFTA